MNTVSIQDLAARTVDAFQKQGYTARSIKEKQWILSKITQQHEKRGELFFNPDVVAQFVQESERRYESGDIKRIYFRFLIKTATYLTELNDTGTINFAQRLVPKLPDYYERLLDDVLSNEVWTAKTGRSVYSFAKTYFGWLHAEGYNDLKNVDEAVVRRYIIDCSSRMMPSSLDTTKRALKKLCAHWFEFGYGNETYEKLLSFPVVMGRKIRRPVPHSEIATVLDVIDRNTVEGKRDYAMILLATVTGLREIDIAGLRFKDIDWRNGEIKIIQSKTEESIALPLTSDVGRAIHDYILNGRPESGHDSIFLRVYAPFREVSGGILYGQFNKYRVKVGLPICPFHDLRRSLGSNMVISGVPVTTVAQVLGHSDIDSTKQYISLDTKHLKECALDFSGIEPQKGKRGGFQ